MQTRFSRGQSSGNDMASSKSIRYCTNAIGCHGHMSQALYGMAYTTFVTGHKHSMAWCHNSQKGKFPYVLMPQRKCWKLADSDLHDLFYGNSFTYPMFVGQIWMILLLEERPELWWRSLDDRGVGVHSPDGSWLTWSLIDEHKRVNTTRLEERLTLIVTIPNRRAQASQSTV